MKSNTRTKLFEFIRFVLVGLTATGVHYGIYYLLMRYINYNFSYSIGYFIALILNFYLSAYFTFKEKPTWGKMIGMAGAHGVNYLLHIILLNLFLFLGYELIHYYTEMNKFRQQVYVICLEVTLLIR